MTEARGIARSAAAVAVALLLAGAAAAQQDPDTVSMPPPYEPVERDPMGSRFVNMPTPFPVGAGQWELLFTHRFQETVQDGDSSDLWGLDSSADIGIGATFGILRNLDVGLFRSSFQEDFELAAKFLVLEQAPRVPLSLAVRAGVDRVEREGVVDPTRPFAQLVVARRFARGVNLVLAPSWVGDTTLLRDAFNVPVGLTLPLPRNRLIEVEVVPGNRDLDDSVAAWHVGFSKAVGGHIFEVVLGNSRATTVDQMLGSDFPPGFEEGDVRLGFNLVRLFPYRSRP